MTDNLGNWLGFDASTENVRRIYSLTFSEEHIGNPLIRALHGGVLATFMEYAALSELEQLSVRPIVYKAINVSVDYLRSAKARDLKASVEMVKKGRNLTVVDVTTWQSDQDKPIARATCSFVGRLAPSGNASQ
ncbi:PaaI family thioesterase [Hyphobacterium indicum]|jgi:uncharacterized protein (TIGR00369 family)|uniref:PaaI family thioesterase n=1 Tax=Hyphobacterium indicum TaxID=2162714 RepID=UPI000D656895|nr:PaaI family thioesterase [Hyphobacterium indicum]|tara:strand:+ start:117 stop:515 length:399 start_codon:yes stop_codon:yes gene_type:complete